MDITICDHVIDANNFVCLGGGCATVDPFAIGYDNESTAQDCTAIVRMNFAFSDPEFKISRLPGTCRAMPLLLNASPGDVLSNLASLVTSLSTMPPVIDASHLKLKSPS